MAHDDLAALEAIRMLKARYFRFVDSRDWEALAALFTEDAELHPAGTDGGQRPPALIGPAAIIRWISRGLAGSSSIHHGFMPEINLTSANGAEAIWAMEDRIEWPDRSLHGFGHYHDRYVRRDRRWLIAATRLERIRVTIVPKG